MYCKLEHNNLHKYFNEISLLNFNENINNNNQYITSNNKNFIDLYIEYIKLLNYPIIRLFKIKKAINIIVKNEDIYFINILNNYLSNINIFNIIKSNLLQSKNDLNYYKILKKILVNKTNIKFNLNYYIEFLNNIFELTYYTKFCKNIYFILLFFLNFKKLNNLIKNKLNLDIINKSYRNYYSLKIYKMAEKYLK
jgi:hypothetical protein